MTIISSGLMSDMLGEIILCGDAYEEGSRKVKPQAISSMHEKLGDAETVKTLVGWLRTRKQNF